MLSLYDWKRNKLHLSEIFSTNHLFLCSHYITDYLYFVFLHTYVPQGVNCFHFKKVNSCWKNSVGTKWNSSSFFAIVDTWQPNFRAFNMLVSQLKTLLSFLITISSHPRAIYFYFPIAYLKDWLKWGIC